MSHCKNVEPVHKIKTFSSAKMFGICYTRTWCLFFLPNSKAQTQLYLFIVSLFLTEPTQATLCQNSQIFCLACLCNFMNASQTLHYSNGNVMAKCQIIRNKPPYSEWNTKGINIFTLPDGFFFSLESKIALRLTLFLVKVIKRDSDINLQTKNNRKLKQQQF